MERTVLSLRIRPDSRSWDEAISAGQEALVRAARVFDPSQCHNGEAGFGPFAVQRIRWLVLKALERERRHGAASLTDEGADGEGLRLIDGLADRSADDPAAQAEVNEWVEENVTKKGYTPLRLADARVLAPKPEGVGAWAEKLREAAFNAVREADITELMESLIARAKGGDLAAARLVLTYLTGGGAPRVQQVVVVQQNAGGPDGTPDVINQGEAS